MDHRTTKQSTIGAARDKQVVSALTTMAQSGIPVSNNVIDQQIQHVCELQAPHLYNTRATPHTNVCNSTIDRLHRIYNITTSSGQHINEKLHTDLHHVRQFIYIMFHSIAVLIIMMIDALIAL